ncbi:MAG: polyprenyl synthetase family protein [Deltaproteobacteria bacterium]|nr:polyprenyl synthetase family protein [Deltaproteobacteria bacterium]
MLYAVAAGGKRVRPVLCLAAAEALGGSQHGALYAACALEMIHTYSLIHDDLPAMDNDRLRRGKPTTHIRYDEATAILAGDALLTLAFQVLSDPLYIAGDMDGVRKSLGIINTIAAAAGHEGMVQGQMLDMLSEGTVLGIEDLRNLHQKKTGALIEASVVTGALLGDAEAAEIKALKQYGAYLGLAFQVADDLLNITGDPQKMGKSVGTDAERNKNTYPSVLGLAESRQFAVELVEKALQAIEAFDKKAHPLRAIARYVIERNR